MEVETWCEALSSGGQKLKIDTSTQIRSTKTLTALKPYQIKPAGAGNILYLHSKWYEALSSGSIKLESDTSTQILSTQTLTALKPGKIKPDLVLDNLALDFLVEVSYDILDFTRRG